MINDFGVKKVVKESNGGVLEIGVFSICAKRGAIVKTVRFVKVKTQDLWAMSTDAGVVATSHLNHKSKEKQR